MVGEEEKKEGCGKAKQRAQRETLTGQVALEPGPHQRPYLHASLPTSTLHNHHNLTFLIKCPIMPYYFLPHKPYLLPPILNFYFLFLINLFQLRN